VRAQRQVKELVGQDEDQLILFQLGDELGVDDQVPGGEDAHRRDALVQGDTDGTGQSREVRERDGDQAQAVFDAPELVLVGGGLGREGDHSLVTLLRRSNMALSAPRAPQRSTRSVRSVSWCSAGRLARKSLTVAGGRSWSRSSLTSWRMQLRMNQR